MGIHNSQVRPLYFCQNVHARKRKFPLEMLSTILGLTNTCLVSFPTQRHIAVQGSILGENYLHLIELLLLVVCHLCRKNKEEKRLLLITERHTESSAFTVDKMLHRQNCFGLCRRLVCYTLRLCRGRCALDIILKPISGGPISCIKPVQPSRRLGPMHLEV